MTRERWPEAPKYEGHPVGPWWCGRCGGLHGWDCPYDKKIYPTGHYDPAKMEEHRAAGVWPFDYGPFPGGTIKETP